MLCIDLNVCDFYFIFVSNSASNDACNKAKYAINNDWSAHSSAAKRSILWTLPAPARFLV